MLSCHLVNSECFVTVRLVQCTRQVPYACRVSKTVNDFLFADGCRITIKPPRADRNKNVVFRKGEISDCWVGKVRSDLKIQLPKICVWVRNRQLLYTSISWYLVSLHCNLVRLHQSGCCLGTIVFAKVCTPHTMHFLVHSLNARKWAKLLYAAARKQMLRFSHK